MAEIVTRHPLRLPRVLREQIERFAVEGHPHEICGLLAGHSTASGTTVVRVTRSRNLSLDRPRDRYTLDPEHYLAVDVLAREDGLEIVGVWHTHPDHPARPSATDREAAWEGLSYLIVSVTPDGVRDATVWRLGADGAFVEQPLGEPDGPRAAAGGGR
jgi:proteasome lid subunit RPN8/RPN11